MGAGGAPAEAAEQLSGGGTPNQWDSAPRREQPPLEEQLQALALNDPLREWLRFQSALWERGQSPAGTGQALAVDPGEPAPEESPGISSPDSPVFSLSEPRGHSSLESPGFSSPDSCTGIPPTPPAGGPTCASTSAQLQPSITSASPQLQGLADLAGGGGPEPQGAHSPWATPKTQPNVPQGALSPRPAAEKQPDGEWRVPWLPPKQPPISATPSHLVCMLPCAHPANPKRIALIWRSLSLSIRALGLLA